MKKFTRERVVPTISASSSWLTPGHYFLWRALLSKLGEKQKDAGQAFFALS
jgi:mannose/cellobiose epimerase-like protein (N-acyl-D-glucosamine 2-epimerase family)